MGVEAGYRLIDTASMYRNEQSVGAAVRRSGLPREQLFVMTKLMPTHTSAERASAESLRRLGVDYVDLYLIHWPLPLVTGRQWRELEGLQEQGLARAIGVSNYSRDRLARLLQSASHPPAVNQVHRGSTQARPVEAHSVRGRPASFRIQQVGFQASKVKLYFTYA